MKINLVSSYILYKLKKQIKIVRWSKIASHLPGRTDNEIKNHWNTHIKKKLKKMGIDPLTHKPLCPSSSSSSSSADPQQLQSPPPTAATGGSTEAQAAQPSPSPPSRKPPEQKTAAAPVTTPPPAATIAASRQELAGDDADGLLLSNSDPGFCTDEVPMMHPDEIMVPVLGDQRLHTPPLPTFSPATAAAAAAAVSTTPTTTTSSSAAASAASSSSLISRDEDAALFPLIDMDFPEIVFRMGLDDMVASWDDSLAQPPLSPSLPVYEDSAYQLQRSGVAFDQEPGNKIQLFSSY